MDEDFVGVEDGDCTRVLGLEAEDRRRGLKGAWSTFVYMVLSAARIVPRSVRKKPQAVK
jgi:hypothetical protein